MTEKYKREEDLGKLVQELTTRLEALERTNQLNRSSVGNTGTFAVGSGSDGEPIFEVGKMTLGDVGAILRRYDGTDAITMKGTFFGDVQDLQMYNRAGDAIFSEHVFGQGIGRPTWNLQGLQPVGPAGTAITCGPNGFERTITSGTFVDAFRWEGKPMNPFVHCKFGVRFSDTTTACEIKVINGFTGATLVGFFNPAWVGVVAAGSTADQELTTTYSLRVPGNYDVFADILTVQVRRTAGAGNVVVCVKSIEGE